MPASGTRNGTLPAFLTRMDNFDAFIREQWQQAFAQAQAQETPAFPPIMYIEPTNACDCNCIICPRTQMTRPIGMMSTALFEKIVDDLLAMPAPSELRLFNYGEPLLHKQLPRMIRYARSKGFRPRFQTNGLQLTAANIQRLLDAGLDYIGISVNGLDAQAYEQIRPGFSFARFLDHVRLLRRMVDDSGQPFHIHINAQVLKEECEARPYAVEAFQRTWSALADSMSVSGLNRYDKIALLCGGQVTKNDLCQLPRKSDEEVACPEPFDRLVIKWDGRVTLCCVDYDARLVVGDLNRQSVSQVWRSPRLQNIRNLVKTRQYQRLPTCRICPRFYSEPYHVVFRAQPEAGVES